MSNLQVRFPVVIDFAKNTYVEVEVTKRSRNGYIMEFYFLNQGKAIPKEDIGVVSLKATTEGGAIVFNDILLAEGEYVEYKISETILAEIGRSTCVLQLMDAEGNLINSFEWYVNVKTSLYDENAYVQQDDITAVRSYVLRAESAADKSEEHEKYLREVHANLGDLEEKLGVVKEDMEDYLQEVEEKVENGAFTGATGIQGPQGPQGETGPQGPQGEPGPQGASGITAPIAGHYVLSVEGGYLYVEYDGDTEPNFELDDEGNLYYVVSGKHKVQIGKVKGEKGDKGDTGEKGDSGEQGPQGEAGPTGENGKDGKTAYEYAKDGGYTGSEEMFTESLANAAELEAYKANSILSKASGEVVTTTDSAKVKPKNIKLFGKGKQRQYEGNQLLDSSEFDSLEYNGVTMTVEDGRVILNGTATNNIDFYLINDGKNIDVRAKLNAKLGVYTLSNNLGVENWFASTTGYTVDNITITSETQLTGAFVRIKSGATYNNSILEIMLNEGDTPKPWEPYVGNEPSPNMNYPQKAEFLGESGSIGGKVLTGNLFNKTTRHLYIDTISDNGLTFTTTSHTNSTYTNVAMLYLDAIPMKVGRQYYVALDIKLVSGSTGGINMMRLWDCNNKDVGSQISITRPQVNSSYQHYITKVDIIESDTNACCIYIQGFNTENAVFEITNVMISAITPDYEPYSEQSFTFQTPNGLRGIPLGQTIPDAIKNSPIHMSGVYWDGEQYQIADTENEDGKDIQRIGEVDNNQWRLNNIVSSSTGYRFIIEIDDILVLRHVPIMCTHFSQQKVSSYVTEGNYISTDEVDSNKGVNIRTEEDTSPFTTIEEMVTWMNENDVKTYYILAEPIITDTANEEKTQLDALVMNYPNTTIVNDAGAYMEVEYVCDTKEHIKQNYTPNSVTQDIQQRLSNVESQITSNS